jgi:hypothetical protein
MMTNNKKKNKRRQTEEHVSRAENCPTHQQVISRLFHYTFFFSNGWLASCQFAVSSADFAAKTEKASAKKKEKKVGPVFFILCGDTNLSSLADGRKDDDCVLHFHIARQCCPIRPAVLLALNCDSSCIRDVIFDDLTSRR